MAQHQHADCADCCASCHTTCVRTLAHCLKQGREEGSLSIVSYYYMAAVVGGIALLILLTLCIMCSCRRRYLSRVQHTHSLQPVRMVVSTAPSPVQQQSSYSVHGHMPPSAPPPAYGAPVYQPSPQTYGAAQPAPTQMYNPQPQMYGAPQQMYVPQEPQPPPPTAPPPQYNDEHSLL
jgi:hypothetical protein